jgi:hypothetical protein
MVFRLLVSDTADLIGEFERREDALAALRAIVADEPDAAADFVVLEFDDATGRRVGDAVHVPAA